MSQKTILTYLASIEEVVLIIAGNVKLITEILPISLQLSLFARAPVKFKRTFRTHGRTAAGRCLLESAGSTSEIRGM